MLNDQSKFDSEEATYSNTGGGGKKRLPPLQARLTRGTVSKALPLDLRSLNGQTMVSLEDKSMGLTPSGNCDWKLNIYHFRNHIMIMYPSKPNTL